MRGFRMLQSTRVANDDRNAPNSFQCNESNLLLVKKLTLAAVWHGACNFLSASQEIAKSESGGGP